MIRQVTLDDRAWILNVCEKAYSGTKYGWNRNDASTSFDIVINKKTVIFLRGERAFFYAFIEPNLCDYSKRCAYMELLVSDGNAAMEVFRLIEAAVVWKNQNNVDRLTISSLTGHKFGDLLIKKLGATPRIVYDIE